MELKDLIDHYGELKSKANRLYREYKSMQSDISLAKQALMMKLDEYGMKSAKTASYGVSTVTKPNIVVQDEQSVIEWLKHTPDIELDTFIGLKTTNLKTYALKHLKDTGEIIAGTELENTESLTIKGNKK